MIGSTKPLQISLMACAAVFLATASAGTSGSIIPFTGVTVASNSSPVVDPWEKAIADVTGDGQPDLILGGPTGPVVFYRYPDWAITIIADSASYDSACGIATGDIDNDGDQDLVMGGVVWFENPLPTGNPLSGNWNRHAIGSDRSHDIVLGDLNRDGKIDVVSRGQGDVGAAIYVYYQIGPDSWTPRSLAAFYGEGLALGDFDKDGDQDIAISGYWYENPGTNSSWARRQFGSFESVAVVKAGDIDGDGRTDLVISASESTDELVWYKTPADPKSQPWTKNQIAASMYRTHGLALADYDQDGDLDIAASEFDGESRLIIFQNSNGIGTAWNSQELGTQGLHNIQTGDIDSDGDYDIFGAYCWGTPSVYLWRNGTASGPRSLDQWTYIQVDNSRAATAFGIGWGDGTADGKLDIVSGSYFYRNPGADMASTWLRTTLPAGIDANFITDVDGDGNCDILAQALPDIYWLEATNGNATAFTSQIVATGIPPTGHGSSQGYALGQIVAGGKPEMVLTSGGGIYFVQIPSNPSAGNWPVVNVTTQSPEEGLALGDFDRDGDLDVSAWYGTGSASTSLSWWENPGTGAGNWVRHNVGSTLAQEGDRVAVADLNGDSLPDIIVTETNNDVSGNSLLWFECPAAPRSATAWLRHTIATNQPALNSMDVADMNNDGAVDVVTGEHRSSGALAVIIWENVNHAASWIAHTVDTGKESHLGARIVDLDADGDFDIVSIAWDAFQYLHLWRNDAIGGSSSDLIPPSVSITSPTSGSTLSSTVTLQSVASDNVGIAGVQFRLDGNNLGLEDTSAPYSLAWDTTSVSNAGHVLTAVARDYAGNQSISNPVPITINNTPDTQPPTTPTNLTATAASAYQVNLSWTASTDNFGVTEYLVFRNGAHIGTSTVNSYQDISVLPATTYGYRVAAVDAAGNTSNQSAAASVNTSNQPSFFEGLLAAYAMNEGSGTSLFDSSGHLNTGTLANGTAWTSGKHGGALVFDGVNDKVLLPSTLSISVPLTLEAWIYPTSYGDWRSIFSKRSDPSNPRFDVGLSSGSGNVYLYTGSITSFSYVPPLNAWTHLCVVMTSASTQLYINGELRQTLGGIPLGSAASAPATIGNTPDEDDPYSGRIDNLRIYSSALSQPEIQAAMNSPVVLKGDLNQDGRVNVVDLQLCINCILAGGSCPDADLNNDGSVNVLDLQIIINIILGIG